jgi:hypothetical protein
MAATGDDDVVGGTLEAAVGAAAAANADATHPDGIASVHAGADA